MREDYGLVLSLVPNVFLFIYLWLACRVGRDFVYRVAIYE